MRDAAASAAMRALRIYVQIFVPDPGAQAQLREQLELEAGCVTKALSDEVVEAILPWELDPEAPDEWLEQARVELGFVLRSFLLDWPDAELELLVERAVEVAEALVD